MLTLHPAALAAAATRADAVSPSRTTIPILSTVKLEARDGTLTITATDLDMEITLRVPAKGELDPICLDAAKLKSVATALKDRPEISIEIDENAHSAIIKSGRSRFVAPTLPAAGFPTLRKIDQAAEISFDGKQLAEALKGADCAISTEETRYYLNGIYLVSGDIHDPSSTDCASMVATDGHRLICRSLPATITGDIIPAIVPRRTCAILREIAEGASEVTLHISSTMIMVDLDNVGYASKLIEGTFPTWRQLVPKTDSPEYSFDTKELLSATKRAVAGVTQAKTTLPIRLDFDDEGTILTIKTKDGTEVAEEFCQHSRLAHNGPSIIGLNPSYLLDILGSLDCETIEISALDSSSPALFTSPTHKDRLAIIMPMRV